MMLGQNYPLQINESQFGDKMKYHVVNHHVHTNCWVFGMVKKNSHQSVFLCVAKRDRTTLCRVIQQHIVPGATIKSDM
jgi:hypothetical protein